MAGAPTASTYEIRDYAASPTTHVVVAEGEVDITAAPSLRAALRLASEHGRGRLVLDLTQATFLDSTAIGALAGHMREAGPAGGKLTVACGNENVLRVLEISGMARALTIRATLDEALALPAQQAMAAETDSTQGCVPPTLELHVRPQAAELGRVRGFAAAAAFRFGLDPRERHDFVVAASEAVANAIEHGRPCRDETILVWVTEQDGTLTFGVRDGGEFDLGPLPADPLPERGRGLRVMSRLVDDVAVQRRDGHTDVELSKHRAGRR
jgi:anti-sigma B factor antagonist